MHLRRSGGILAPRLLTWLSVPILLAGCALAAPAQQTATRGDRVAAGDAATVGQTAPGLYTRTQTGQIANDTPPGTDPLRARQQGELRKLRFETMKSDVRQLADLTKSLQEEIEKSNQNVLAAGITEKARKIQKLAGKIRNESQY